MRAFWLSLAAVLASAVVIVVLTARAADAPVGQTAEGVRSETAPVVLAFVEESELEIEESVPSDIESPEFTPLDVATRVMFIGNSYTLSNDMPSTVALIGQANDIVLDIGMNAHPGFSLATHLERSHALETLHNQDWDVVVIQELSTFPADPTSFETSTKPAVATFVADAESVDTDVIFFETWGHREGNLDIGQPGYGPMQRAVNASYEELAVLHEARLAPVGDAWADALATNPEIELYIEDGSHPTPAGSYLAALVLARTLSGDPLIVAPAIGVDQATADALLVHANAAVGAAD